MEQQPCTVELIPEEAVVAPLTVVHITDERVEDMLEVSPDLVSAPGKRFCCDQRIAAGCIATHCKRQFDRSQASITGDRLLGIFPLLSIRVMFVLFLQQRIVYQAALRRDPTADRKILLTNLTGGEGGCKNGGILRGECEKKHTGGRFVEPVDRIDPLAEHVARHLQGEPLFAAIDETAMQQQTGRFVEDSYSVVSVKQGELFHQ